MSEGIGVEVKLLGPFQILVFGNVIEIPGPKQRVILALLALTPNVAVSVDALVDAVWGDDPPVGAEHSLQQHISAIRKLLGSATSVLSGAELLLTKNPGYALRVQSSDAQRFDEASRAGFEAMQQRNWSGAVASFDRALDAWTAAALSDVRDAERLNAAATRLDEQRIATREASFDARLELGQDRELVAELEHLVEEYPFRERLRAQLMTALYRSGRQADALAAFQNARNTLIDELGIEPGPELRDLEQLILEQRVTPASSVKEQAEIFATYRADRRAAVSRLVLPDGQMMVVVDGTTVVGRDPAAQIRFVDSRVSRLHAEIDLEGGIATLRDTRSTNGTAVNGTTVVATVLSDGDVVSLGGFELTYRRGSDA